MAYQKITLTQNGQYFAMRSGQYAGKTDIITMQLSEQSVLDGASLLEYRAFTDKDGIIALDDTAPFVDGAGTQIQISAIQQVSRSIANKNIWHIFVVQNATINTSIQIVFDGIDKRYSDGLVIQDL